MQRNKLLIMKNYDYFSWINSKEEYMDIKTLRHFLSLCESLNFTRAADENFISQSTLSKQIKQLEEELGAHLFIRDKRNVTLTEAGRFFRDEVSKITNQMDFIIRHTRQLDKGEAGEIKIGYTHSAMQSLLPSLIYELNQKFPNLKTTLMEMTNTHQIEALRAQDIDISISPNPIIEQGVKSRVLITGNFALVLPVRHKLNKRNLKNVSQLAEESFILPAKTEGTLYVGIIESICTDVGFFPRIVHETSYANTGIRLVQAGIGITIEPVYGLSGYSNIKIIELKDIRQKAELTMLWLPGFEKKFPGIIPLLEEFEYRSGQKGESE